MPVLGICSGLAFPWFAETVAQVQGGDWFVMVPNGPPIFGICKATNDVNPGMSPKVGYLPDTTNRIQRGGSGGKV